MPNGVIKYDTDGYGEVEASAVFCHGNGTHMGGVLLHQFGRKALRFGAEKEKVTWLEGALEIGTLRFGRGEKETLFLITVGTQKVIQAFPYRHIQQFPVVQSRPPERFFTHIKTDRFDDVQFAVGIDAYAPDRASILRDLRMNEDDVEHQKIIVLLP